MAREPDCSTRSSQARLPSMRSRCASHPDERVKPVNRTGEPGQHLGQAVPPLHMRQLVQEHGAEPLVRPVSAPAGRRITGRSTPQVIGEVVSSPRSNTTRRDPRNRRPVDRPARSVAHRSTADRRPEIRRSLAWPASNGVRARRPAPTPQAAASQEAQSTAAERSKTRSRGDGVAACDDGLTAVGGRSSGRPCEPAPARPEHVPRHRHGKALRASRRERQARPGTCCAAGSELARTAGRASGPRHRRRSGQGRRPDQVSHRRGGSPQGRATRPRRPWRA